jgi:predicted DNA-binding transcriptional regulator YafY
MPKNLQAHARYMVIDRCLSDRLKKYWSLEELLNKLDEKDLIIKKRTLERDLEALRHDSRLAFYAPLVYCRTNRGYHYVVEGYSINSFNFSDADLKVLHFGIAFVKEYGGVVTEFGELVERVVERSRK